MSNMQVCKEIMDIQIQMALSDLAKEKVDELGTKLCGYFAPTVEWKVNPDKSGPSTAGDLQAGACLIAQQWSDVLNVQTKIDSFTPKSNGVIQVVQLVDAVLVDSQGTQVPETSLKDLKLTQTLTFNPIGKVQAWTQEYDTGVLQNLRGNKVGL